MRSLPPNLTASLLALQAVAAATVLRSVLLERWATVVAATVLVLGAQAALRGRTWGIGVVLTTSVVFPGAVLLGFAPSWFWLVGLAGLVPFLLTVGPMARFDRGATALFTALAGGIGVASTYAFREACVAIFYALH